MQDSLKIDSLVALSPKSIVLGNKAELCSTLENNSNVYANSYILNETLTVVSLLFIVAFFCCTIYYNKSIVRSILNFPFSKFSEDNLRDSNDLKVIKVLQQFSLLYVLSLTLGFLKIGEVTYFSTKIEPLNKYGALIFIIYMLLYNIYVKTANSALEWYNFQNYFFREYWFEKNLICSFLGIIATPCVILCVFASSNVIFYTKYVFFFIAITSIGYYLIKTYRFFKLKNVSLLQYILYFCTVEFIPISLLYVVINRYLDVYF